MKKFYLALWYLLGAISFSSLTVIGNVEYEVITHQQNAHPSKEYPAKLKLRSKVFNVTRQQKYLYQSAHAVLFTSFPIMFLVYFVGRLGKKHKVLPPIKA